MTYSKKMAKEDIMSTLYKNRVNLTIEVLVYACITLHLYVINCSITESFKFTIMKVLKFW